MPISLLTEIESRQWAITEDAYRCIKAALTHDISENDYHYFHAVNKEQKEALAVTFGQRVANTYYTGIRNNVGFLMIDGPIMPRATMFSDVSGMVSLDTLTNEYKALMDNNTVDSIVLLIDSPGGAVTGTADFAQLIKDSPKATYTYAWMAASAAYWIGSAADKLVMANTGEVGSVGVVFHGSDYSERDKKQGISKFEFTSTQTPYKRAQPTSPEGQAIYQNQVDYLASVFIETVANNRGVTSEDVLNNFGKGAMVMAKPALESKMVDDIMDVEAFVNSIVRNQITSFSLSANTDTNVKGDSMANSKENPLTAQELRDQHMAAVSEIESAAIAVEQKRIKGIEAIADEYTKASVDTQSAVKAEINACKFDATLDEAAVLRRVMRAANNIETEQHEAIAKPRLEASSIAAHASKAQAQSTGDDNKEVSEKQKIDKLVNALKMVNGEVK